MIWVGVTGGIGCGKSTVISILEELGFGVVSADKVVHDLYLSQAVVSDLSKLLSIEQKEFSREKVASVVFSNREKLMQLEGYLHPLVREETERLKRIYENEKRAMAFYEIPLLFEKEMQGRFTCTVCVGAEPHIQIARIKKRNTWSDEEIAKRLASQLPLEKKKSLSDFYIDNSFGLSELRENCVKTVESIEKNAQALKT